MNYLGLNKNGTKAIAKELNDLLASYSIYYQNLRNFHWNVKGYNFFELHTQFENLYNSAMANIDEIAERILILRQAPVSNYSEYLSMSEVKEALDVVKDLDMVTTTLESHKTLIRLMREVLLVTEEYNDDGTSDMMGSFIAEMEKTSWMLAAWLQGAEKKELSAVDM